MLKGAKAHERSLPAAAGGLGHGGTTLEERETRGEGASVAEWWSTQPVEGKPHSRGNGQRHSGIAEPIRAILRQARNSERAANSESTPVKKSKTEEINISLACMD